ncbi:FAD:protein FMN transferase [Flammeovirga kamogawensis]|uniref:FAD:protein FMN transferase n=1 Tax=Flammeovirga kamogawensis TaxID=373891 RepID=A0ABX8GTP4_9BACT|nr:FAD:protein FMN transferase [Flammeovirga kamogawensis]MBB6460021.1 thiamine biosynthesis lipoprotein [Flammeovirga kamogawensis]QWG06931.1 FAD:protein FMN transferase [Flammeovirga kamogawensis]TRX68752.1 FAD:protein FMN transferase [Flammeovirga kamogawensis]
MDYRKKNIIYSIILIAFIGIVWSYRQSHQPINTHFHVTGTTMGVVPYNVKYIDEQGRPLDNEIKTALKEFNQSLSTYIPSSEISRFNSGDQLTYESKYFYPVIKESKIIYDETGGAFDPTIQPLVKAWGFGPGKTPTIKPEQVDSILEYVGFDQYISFTDKVVSKSKKGVELDFSAIAKGYAVDIVADLLRERNISNFMVEIGGEVVCSGKNEKGKLWKIGIDNPRFSESGKNQISIIVELDNKALATSGNYRNFYIKEGKKYAHTLDPRTGFPVQHSLLSASVFTPSCMASDAYATAFMVAGVEKSIRIIESNPEIEAILIYDDNGEMKNYISSGAEKYIYKK